MEKHDVPKSKQNPYLMFLNILLVPGQPSEQSPHAKSTTYLKIIQLYMNLNMNIPRLYTEKGSKIGVV